MARLHMDLTGNANFIHVTGMANTVTSAIVHFIHVVILQLEESGLRAKVSGTVKTATGYIQKKLHIRN